MVQSSFWQTVRKQILSVKSLFWIILISFFYFSFSVLILNYSFVVASLLGAYPVFYKFKVIYALLTGASSAFSPLDLYFLILTSLLVGLNTLMIIKTLKELAGYKGKLSIIMGGTTLVGVAATGCTSCGFSLLSILGLAGALSFIPLAGLGLHIIVVALLLFSFWYSLKSYHNKIVCKI